MAPHGLDNLFLALHAGRQRRASGLAQRRCFIGSVQLRFSDPAERVMQRDQRTCSKRHLPCEPLGALGRDKGAAPAAHSFANARRGTEALRPRRNEAVQLGEPVFLQVLCAQRRLAVPLFERARFREGQCDGAVKVAKCVARRGRLATHERRLQTLEHPEPAPVHAVVLDALRRYMREQAVVARQEHARLYEQRRRANGFGRLVEGRQQARGVLQRGQLLGHDGLALGDERGGNDARLLLKCGEVRQRVAQAVAGRGECRPQAGELGNEAAHSLHARQLRVAVRKEKRVCFGHPGALG